MGIASYPWKKGDTYEIEGFKLQVIDEIGSGGMSSVWLLKLADQNVWLTGKIILPDSKNSRELENFKKECRISLSLEPDPNVAVTIAVGMLPAGEYVILTEYVPGPNLSEWIAENSAELINLRDSIDEQDRKKFWSIVISMAIKVATGICHLHSNGFAHRDLKTLNIVLKQTDPNQRKSGLKKLVPSEIVIKIVDFGLAKMRDLGSEATTSGMFHSGLIQSKDSVGAGTYMYAPPEQIDVIRPESAQQPDTMLFDLFSYGVILCELISVGSRPFDEIAAEAIDLIQKRESDKISPDTFTHSYESCIQRERYETCLSSFVSRYLSRCPHEILEIIVSLLQFHPNDRSRSYDKHRSAKYPADLFCKLAVKLIMIYTDLIQKQFDPKIDNFALSGNYLLYDGRASSLSKLGYIDEGLKIADKAIGLNLEDEISLVGKYMILEIYLKDFDAALSVCNYAIIRNPMSFRAWDDKGRILFALGRYEEAVEALDKALMLDPNRILTYCLKGECLIQLESYEKAMAVFDRALLLDPNHGPTLARKAYAYNKWSQTRNFMNS